MTDFPRLRWLVVLQAVVLAAASFDAGSVLEALQSAGVLAPGIVSIILVVLRAAKAYSQVDGEDVDDPLVHTMEDGRSVKPIGVWREVW